MYRLIVFSLQFIILLTALTFIFTNPFTISLDIKNIKYSFSSNIFAAIALIFILSFYAILFLYFKSRITFVNYLLKNKYRKLDKGYFYFVEAMIAIANKDNRSAIKSHKKMQSYLKDDPSLSLLLKSEVYKIERNYSELSEIYEKMLKSKKTESLGLRGLMEQNLKNQDYHHAFLYGEKLFSLNPSIEKLYDTLIYIAAKTKNWNQLIIISDKAYNKKIINRDLLYENKSIGFYEIANINSESNLKDATKNILKALDLKKNFPPYIKLHLELISKSNNLSLLKKYIKRYWSSNPNSIVRNILTDIIISNNIKDLPFIYQIIKTNRDYDESKKLLVYFAIQNQEWKIARDNITGLIGPNPSREVCLFMADIELGENNDKQKSDSWILRSENTLVENLWFCKITKKTQQEWKSLSEAGYFNSLVLDESKMLSNN
ncbi:hypothetical protein N9U75_00775 [Pelagibacteraceae bacterium]|nr:hypothetical protein [Pelagibacteraceae bacterium]